MNKSSLCLCGPRSKSGITGVALAFDLLVEGLNKRRYPCRVVDATFGGKVSKSGTFSLKRAFETVWVILLVWFHLFRCEIYYATMATSAVGFVRDFLTVAFARLLRNRVILHLHGGGFEAFYLNSRPWLQRLIRSNLGRVDQIVVLGELLKEQFYCVGDFVKPKLAVVPNGLTLGVNEPHGATKKLPADSRIELLYLSSLMPSKGFYDVLQAVSLLEKEHPGRYHLNLCGSFVDAKTETKVEVSDEVSLKRFIQESGLNNCVSYHGQVLGREKQAQFERAHIFLLPTSYPWEGQPLSIIEALAFATPIISCYHRGIPELIEDGVTGRFVKPRSPKSIFDALLEMTSDPDKYEQMSRAARSHYESNFRRDVHLERLISVITAGSAQRHQHR